MILRLAFRRLLPLLAVLSLALAPVTAPAATASMHASTAAQVATTGLDAHSHGMAMDMAGMAMDEQAVDDMPCCPKENAAKPDCTKGCPLMALCGASVVSTLPAALPLPAPAGMRSSLTWPASASFASVPGTPLPEPPRA